MGRKNQPGVANNVGSGKTRKTFGIEVLNRGDMIGGMPIHHELTIVLGDDNSSRVNKTKAYFSKGLLKKLHDLLRNGLDKKSEEKFLLKASRRLVPEAKAVLPFLRKDWCATDLFLHNSLFLIVYWSSDYEIFPPKILKHIKKEVRF